MKIFLILLTVLVISISCAKDEPLQTDSNKTKVTIMLTDNPTNLEQVNVDIQKVLLKGPGKSVEIELGTKSGIYDLLTLQNGVEVLLGDGIIEIDTLKQIRLILGEENSVMADGVMHELKTPSAQQSGLKIQLKKALLGLDNTVILLDFDAEKSVKELGNGDFMLKPVINVLE